MKRTKVMDRLFSEKPEDRKFSDEVKDAIDKAKSDGSCDMPGYTVKTESDTGEQLSITDKSTGEKTLITDTGEDLKVKPADETPKTFSEETPPTTDPVLAAVAEVKQLVTDVAKKHDELAAKVDTIAPAKTEDKPADTTATMSDTVTAETVAGMEKCTEPVTDETKALADGWKKFEDCWYKPKAEALTVDPNAAETKTFSAGGESKEISDAAKLLISAYSGTGK